MLYIIAQYNGHTFKYPETSPECFEDPFLDSLSCKIFLITLSLGFTFSVDVKLNKNCDADNLFSLFCKVLVKGLCERKGKIWERNQAQMEETQESLLENTQHVKKLWFS